MPALSVVTVLPVNPLPVTTGAVIPIAGSPVADAVSNDGSASPETVISLNCEMPSLVGYVDPFCVMATIAAIAMMTAITAPMMYFAFPLDFLLMITPIFVWEVL